jgi:hypothetical protein
MPELPYELESCAGWGRPGPQPGVPLRSAAQASRHLRRRETAIRKFEAFSLKHVGPDELSVGAGQEHEVGIEKGAMCSGGPPGSGVPHHVDGQEFGRHSKAAQ